MNLGTVNTTVENKIAVLEFSHPASNALPLVLLEELKNQFISLSSNKNVCVIVLKSLGDRAFCAGAFFDEIINISTKEEGTAFFMGFANLLNAMRTCTKLIIASVQGEVVGGGVGLVAACDYCFALEKAAIKLSELTIGIGPFVIQPAVERKIGKAAFCELSLDATHWQNAYWAKEKGLFTVVYQSRQDMNNAVVEFSEKLASFYPEALLEMKRVFWEGTASWEELLPQRAKTSGKLILSNYTKLALSKFKK